MVNGEKVSFKFMQVSSGPTMTNYMIFYIYLSSSQSSVVIPRGIKGNFGLYSSIRPSTSSMLSHRRFFQSILCFHDFAIIILRNFTLNLFLNSVYVYPCIRIG